MPSDNLPAPIGINAAHLNLRDEFLRKLTTILNESAISLKTYAVTENYETSERVSLETDGYRIDIALISRR